METDFVWLCYIQQEYEIVDYFLGPPGTNKLKDEVMKVQPVQKQTRAGQRTRFKAFVLVGDFDGHVGLGVKVGKEVANAIRGAILAAKLEVVPVRRGYWGKKIGLPHTVPNKIHGKCGSVHIRLVPAPRGTGIVAAPTSKRILQYAGVTDCFTSSSGSSATLGNFAKATFNALGRLYGYLTPDLWKETKFTKQPFQVRFLSDALYLSITPVSSYLDSQQPEQSRGCRFFCHAYRVVFTSVSTFRGHAAVYQGFFTPPHHTCLLVLLHVVARKEKHALC